MKQKKVIYILSRLQEDDFTCIQKLPTPVSEEEKILFKLVKRYHDLFSALYNYFEAGNRKINVLSLTCGERIESGRNIARANEYIAEASKKQAFLSEKCADVVGNFIANFDNMLKSSADLSNECNQAMDISRQGRNNITQYLDESKKTQELLINIAQQTVQLNDNMTQIKEILNLIEGISDQTNILAINARIESVHVGAAGAGSLQEK